MFGIPVSLESQLVYGDYTERLNINNHGYLEQFEGHGQMVVLQHTLIVVHQGQLRGGVDEVLVGEARVVHVVDGGREGGRHHLQGREHTLGDF